MNFNGHYRGRVLDNNGDMGQCKIYVPGVYPIELDTVSIESESSYAAKLPWAEPAMPLFGGSTESMGMCSWPDVGAIVWVFFDGGAIERPVYFACVPGGNAWISEHNKQYVVQTEHAKIIIDDVSKTITLNMTETVNINAPTTNINGELHVTGNIKGDKEIEDKTANMTTDRSIFDAHVHPYLDTPVGASFTDATKTPQS